MLASPGELQALSLACELSSNLDALLSGLSGLEQLMLPAIDADTACGGLGCLSTLTRLTGTHSGVLSTLRKLKWLDIRSTVVEDLASAAIASLPSLESLNTRGVLFGPDAALAVARGCPALRAWDIRCCQLTRRQMAALMAARPHVALMSSGKPAFIADERAFAVFEGDEVTPSRMNLRQHLDALVNEHFGVREDWPPLSQPTVSAIVRGYSDGWGARMMADADASSLTSAEFWVEMLWFAAYVIVGGCNTADRAQYARPPHNDPSMVTRSQAGSSTAGSVMMHLHVALHALSSCTSSATLIVRIWIYICACLIICLLTLLVLVARTLRSGWDALLQ